MALSKPSPVVAPAENYFRFGAAFDAIDSNASDLAGLLSTVSGLATKAALANEVLQRGLADAGEAQARQAADAAEATIRQTNDDSLFRQLQAEAGVRQVNDDNIFTSLRDLIAAQNAGVQQQFLDEAAARLAGLAAMPLSIPVLHRPGDAPQIFTQSTVGGEADPLPSLPLSLLTVSDAGRVVRLTGNCIVLPRHMYAVEPGRRYAVTFVVQRRRNSPDPANDAIRCGLLWFEAGKGALATYPGTVIEDVLQATTGSGRVVVTAIVARAAAADVTFVAPPLAVYAKPYVQIFGTIVQSDVEVIGWEDITDAQAFAPDVSGLAARLATQEGLHAGDRLGALEAELTSPSALRLPTFADIPGATVPGSANTIQVQGNTAQGDGGAAIYRRVTQAPAHPAYAASLDGSIWELSEKLITPQMFGHADWAGSFDASRAYFTATGSGTYADFVRPAADYQRNYCTVVVPRINDLFVDNVLAIQNLSQGYVNGTLRSGNAAINFLDRAGIERCVIGYSRNAALAPQAGYFPNLLYLECGNPFTSDGEVTTFGLVVTIKAGSQYWGGAAVSYRAIEVDSRNGDLRLRSNDGAGAITFQGDTYVGLWGENTRMFSVATQASRLRVRERRSANQISLTTNIANMAADASGPIAKDVSTDPAWEVTFGALDRFAIWRAPPTGGSLAEMIALDPHEGFVVAGSVGSPRLRVRERGSAGQFALAINVANMDQTRTSMAKDVAGLAAYELAFDPTADRVSLFRAAPGSTALAEMVTLNAAGNLGNMQTAPAEAFHVTRGANPTGLTRTGFRADIGGAFGGLFAGYLEQGVGGGAIIYAASGSGFLEALRIDNTLAVRPGADGTQALGTSALRWGSVSAMTLNLTGSAAPTASSDTSGALGDVRVVGNALFWKTASGWVRAVGATF